ncbi:hypothetical protein [Sulfurimonas sp. NWX367]|uniref:hypothetical protein n=1 Tax=Sulfurimonas sp. NWX367 TaxID=2925413 RepID=UPI003204C5BC
MKDKYLYIVDMRFKQNSFDLSSYLKDIDANILSLTPYSSFLLKQAKKKFITFHDIVSIEEFHKNVFKEYKEFEEIFNDFKELSFLFRDFAFLITFEKYFNQLKSYLKLAKKENRQIFYLTDVDGIKREENCLLYKSCLFDNQYVDKIINIKNKDASFYKKNKLQNIFNTLKYKKDIFENIINKYILRKDTSLPYDMIHFLDVYNDLNPVTRKESIEKKQIFDFIGRVNKTIIDKKNSLFKNQYMKLLEDITIHLTKYDEKYIIIKPFSFLSRMQNYRQILINKKNSIPNIFMQHGSYLQENIFLKYNEIYPADINFVFNDFTKELFQNRGAKKIESVGSINFNYSIKEKKKKFDFLYITYCTGYSYTGVLINNFSHLVSTDTNNIYTRHKKIIELFGVKLKDKNICIKIQPGIMLETMLYIPFLELSQNYPNVTIEFSIPIQNLIPKSKYIISDYFSSEFINRELHYKRDIILFSGPPLCLPEETLEDMKKMFILVDTVDDLEEKVRNIENITKNRKRYDDIIEYYSSKKCDTKKLVTEILEKELNART